MANIKAQIGKEHYKTILSSATNQIIGDEPISSGGTALGFSPEELLAASLATCTSITLRMYADRKNWALEKIEVNVIFERDAEKNISNIIREITLTGKLTTEEQQRLLQIANQCPIHKTLSNPINIKTILNERYY
jgi:putative redox protein